MAVIRNERKFRYTVVPNDPLRNANLTLQAKGLLALMLSYPDDWNYNLTHLEGQSRNKRDAHRNALRELIAAGYAEWRTVHGEDGTFQGRELVVTDVPFHREPGNPALGDDRGTENPARGDSRPEARQANDSRAEHRGPEKPTVGKSEATKDLSLTKTDKTKKEKTLTRARRGADVRPEHQPFLEAWNANRGPLPAANTVDDERARNLDKLIAAYGDEALDRFTDAAKRVATEPWWIDNAYGFENLIRGGKVLSYSEKWRAAGAANPARGSLVTAEPHVRAAQQATSLLAHLEGRRAS